MPGRWGIGVALGCALLVAGVPGTVAAAGGVCWAEARDPKAVVIDGVPHVRAVHLVECGVPVDSVRVEGTLVMDGRVVATAARSCTLATRCQVSTTARNPAGLQAWRGSSRGSFARGSEVWSIRAVRSATVWL